MECALIELDVRRFGLPYVENNQFAFMSGHLSFGRKRLVKRPSVGE
jgi:hypothetical protein